MPPAADPPTCERGVLYLKWGSGLEALHQRSIASLKAIHPELPIYTQELPAGATLLDKARIFEFTPFEETLYLDVDTVVLDRLDFGFEMAAKHGLACAICENPWARRYGGIRGDLVEYNTGVLFFTRRAAPIFEAWAECVRAVDSSIEIPGMPPMRMPCNDQAGFALAVAKQSTPPFVLPLNWNFRPKWTPAWFGLIKIWHDYADPPADFLTCNAGLRAAGASPQYVRFNPR